MNTQWVGIGTGNDKKSILLSVDIPLGAKTPPNRWQGFGISSRLTEQSTPDLWRTNTAIGKIRVAERTITPVTTAKPASSGTYVRVNPERVTAKILDSTTSGKQVTARVMLEEATIYDVHLHISLIPGSGANPARPGIDYVNEVIEVTIPQGALQIDIPIQLLEANSHRALGITAALAPHLI